VGESLGRSVACVMTDMDQPLGASVGNALEVAEAIRVLRGEGDGELVEVCRVLAAKMLMLARGTSGELDAAREVDAALDSGAALTRFYEWVAAQGGDPNVADDTSLLPRSAHERSVRAGETGYVARLDAEAIGRAAMELGAGRKRADDALDPGAGVVCEVRVGDYVSAGDVVFVMHAATEALLDVGEERLRHSVHVSSEAVAPRRILRDLVAEDAGEMA
jgi:pyrimidine-nucleoside phosphorylase